MSSFINFKNSAQTSTKMATNSRFTRQSSIYAAFTLDELQSTLCENGNDFGSMNMDELLKNIWRSEATQATPPDSNLQKQGSLTLTRTISQKTVDEVSRDLVKENGRFVTKPNMLPPEKWPSLGEMTLEDFLQKAGVVPEKNQTQPNGRLFGDVLAFKNPKQQKILTNSNLDYAYGETGVHETRSGASFEKGVERRRKRMIKNRESAARSRDRKQAYILELEAEVEKLKEINHQLLQKQEEIVESRKFQTPEKMKLYGSKRLCLRRTMTGPW